MHVCYIPTVHCNYYESLFKVFVWKLDLLKMYKRLECGDSKLQSNNCTLSNYPKQTYFLRILEQLFLEHLTDEPDILFWEIYLKICIYTILTAEPGILFWEIYLKISIYTIFCTSSRLDILKLKTNQEEVILRYQKTVLCLMSFW